MARRPGFNARQCASLPAACAPDTAYAVYGADRITKTHYDAADQVVRVESGVGTALRRDDVRATYGLNGEVATVTDANGNMTTYEYDGHGRLERTRYPHKTTDGVSSITDDELLPTTCSAGCSRRASPAIRSRSPMTPWGAT